MHPAPGTSGDKINGTLLDVLFKMTDEPVFNSPVSLASFVSRVIGYNFDDKERLSVECHVNYVLDISFCLYFTLIN